MHRLTRTTLPSNLIHTTPTASPVGSRPSRRAVSVFVGEVMRADPLTSLSTILTEQKMLRIARLAYDVADVMIAV